MAVSNLVTTGGLATTDLVTQPQWTLLASNTGTTGVSSISFTGIPATYRTLRFITTGVQLSVGQYMYMRFNSNTGSVYNRTSYYETTNLMYGPANTRNVGSSSLMLSFQSGAVHAHDFLIENYSSSTEYKIIKGDTTYANDHEFMTGHFGSTAAISSIEFYPAGGTVTPNPVGVGAVGCGIFLYGAK